jgi:signal transduction histidine kinase
LFFFINTISFQEHFPKWAIRVRLYGWIWLSYVLAASCLSPFLYDNSFKYYSLAISLLFQQITLIIVIVCSIQVLRKKDRYALPFLVASSLFILTHFQYLAHRFGHTDDTVVQQHFVPIILGMDCLIIGGIVALRFIDFIQKNKQLEMTLLNKDIEINERIAGIQLRELSRISQLLHNHIGMELIGLKNNLEQNKNKIPDHIHQILLDQTTGLIEDVRNTAHFLSPQVLRKFGLAHCIQLFVKEICKTKQINHYVEITAGCNETSTNIQLVVMLVIQECLNNTIKHAQASEIQVQCFVENQHLYISYQDNGVGIESKESKDGIGLMQITEMINVCRGQSSIQSLPGEGFQLEAEIPLDA